MSVLPNKKKFKYLKGLLFMEKQLTNGKMAIMGLQHVFAMFGATILVPLITGLSVQVTLVGVGIGTLIFHIIQKRKGNTWARGVPIFLGSSFAFMAGIRVVTGGGYHLSDATGGILIAGVFYLVIALLVKIFGPHKVMSFMPTVVTAPTVILIGVMLAPFAIDMARHNFILSITTLVTIIVIAIYTKGMLKIIPVLIGIGVGALLSVILHFIFRLDVHSAEQAGRIEAASTALIGLPPIMLPTFNLVPILIMFPFVFATIAEHIADLVILSRQSGNDYINNPGMHRTLAGDGVAQIFQGLIGAPAATTYSENVGVVTLTRVFDARILIAAGAYAALLGFSPLFAKVIYWIPEAVIGGASFILYGMIAAVGLRNLIDDRVNLADMKNCIIVAVMLVTGLGLRFGLPIAFSIGETEVPISRLGVAIAVVLGIILNAVLKGTVAETNSLKAE
jgi:uracil permease